MRMNEPRGALPTLTSRRFALVGKLGEGGMGSVYEVVDRERQARVALKTLRQLGPEWVERLKHEFRSLQDLHHPNLVSLGELVEEAGRCYFTMELVRGCNFLQYVRPHAPPSVGASGQATGSSQRVEGAQATAPLPRPASEAATGVLSPLPAEDSELRGSALPVPAAVLEEPHFDEQRLRSALAQLARGLHALHRAGKVHRDIKPSNILVTESGRVVLLDFGVLSDVQEPGAWEGTVVGTAAYMAPEQAGGDPTSPPADWYSVGVLLYESLTGHVPFTGTAQEVMYAKRRLEPVPPQARVAGLPEDLCQLCVELLRSSPAQRPTGEELLWRLGAQEEAAEWYLATLPFVGRQRELAVLYEALADSRRGGSVCMLVEGEPGVGKSRLVRRFLEEVRQRVPEAQVFSGRCYERESVAYKGVEGLVADLARHLRRLGEEAVRALQPEAAPALLQLFPVLQQVPGLAGSAPLAGPAPVPALLPGELSEVREQASHTLRELLARLAARAPVLLAVDDLQWADGPGLALVDEVLRAPGVLLVATLREGTTLDEQAHVLEQEQARFLRSARWLPLRGLSSEEVRELLGSSLPAEQALRIAEESGGQPLFVDVLVHHYYRGGSVPERALRLEEALWARVRQLEPAARQLLELLTVADGPLPQSAAARATAFDFAEYARLAAALRSAHLALTSGPSGSDTIVLVHERVRGSVLLHMEESTWQHWHSRLASALETLGEGEPEALARHWREAGQPERAVGYYLRAAHQAGQARNWSRQAALYATALELGHFEPVESLRLQSARAQALARAGLGEEAAALFLEAARMTSGEESLELRRRAAEQQLASGHIAEGLELLRQVLAEAGLPWPRSMGWALVSLLWQRLRLALRPLGWHLRLAEQVPPRLLLQVDASWSASTNLSLVAPLEAAGFAFRHLWLALEAGEAQRVLRALLAEALRRSFFGPRQRRGLERLLARLEPLLAQPPEDPVTQGLLGLARMAGPWCAGELPRVRVHLELALHQLPQLQGEFWLEVLIWGLWAEVAALSGDLVEMQRQLAQPVAAARERNDPAGLTLLQMGYPSLGWLAQGEPREARRLAEELIALWPRERFLIAHLRHLQALSYIDLYEGRGEQVLARLEAHRGPLRWVAGQAASLRCMVGDLRSRALLQHGVQRGGSEGRRLLRAAEAEGRALEREGLGYTRVQALLLRAGLALGRGQLEQARREYARAAELAEATGMRLHAAAARWRQAELEGGEQGHLHLEEARRTLRDQGMLFPEAMVGLLAPARGG
jgi:eukaryotic-like serine/threonine-protein kinase